MMTIFEVLADPTRRTILGLLLEQPRVVGELVAHLQLSQPLISKHLRVLREIGLVEMKQDARNHRYELRTEPLAELEDWLKPYRNYMEARYARLDALLEALKENEENDEEAKPDR